MIFTIFAAARKKSLRGGLSCHTTEKKPSTRQKEKNPPSCHRGFIFWMVALWIQRRNKTIGFEFKHSLPRNCCQNSACLIFFLNTQVTDSAVRELNKNTLQFQGRSSIKTFLNLACFFPPKHKLELLQITVPLCLYRRKAAAGVVARNRTKEFKKPTQITCFKWSFVI